VGRSVRPIASIERWCLEAGLMSARRILLVDDSSTMRRMISTLLVDQGYEVKTAVDGNDGLAKAGEEPFPELILTDFEMPELDGPGLCRALKANKSLATIPVLMLTTLGETKSKVEGLDAGADDFIQKPKSPGDIEELFARIRAHFRLADMGRELAERNYLLESAHKKIHFELELARKVQRALMPRPPRPRGVLRAAVKYTPANQLGGDIYDFYRLDQNRLGVLVADVSGHGVNSAMLSGMVKALGAGLSIAVVEPGELLAGLDVSLEQYFPEGYFCTGFYLIADEETGLIRYAGVGHPPAIVIGPKGVRTLESNPGLLGVGMVDGTAGDVDRLVPGESLVVYTDGLPDAMDPSDVLFGEERLKAVLQTYHGADPATILDEVEKAVNKHTFPGTAADDINMVVIQYPLA
jgi:sigma-B regulation protein RsbU (phosphoserine phosphatase)